LNIKFRLMHTLRFALVGNGRVAVRHIDALTRKVPGAKLVAVCDILPERLKAVQELGFKTFTSTKDLYAWGEFDVATLCTPSGSHFEHAMEAISARKHVVVEKPVALRLDHVDLMSTAASRANVKVWVAHQNRYNPAIVKAKQALDSGRLGKKTLATIRVRWCR